MTRSTVLLAVTMLVAGCGAPYGARPGAGIGGAPGVGPAVDPRPGVRRGPTIVTLRTDAQQYARGAEVWLILENGSDGWVHHDPCAAVLEGFAAGRWQPVSTAAHACVPSAARVPPGGFARQTLRLPAELHAGRYRFRQEVEDQATMGYLSVLSNMFTVD
jgi:hypothetical protein